MFVALILSLLERQLMRCWRCALCIYVSEQKDKLQTKQDADTVWSLKPLKYVIKHKQLHRQISVTSYALTSVAVVNVLARIYELHSHAGAQLFTLNCAFFVSFMT